MPEPSPQYSIELAAPELDIVRDALQLLLRSERDPVVVERIQAILARFPGDPASARGDTVPLRPWW